MAVRRGVVLVLVLIAAAVAVSVAGLVVTALLVGREPRIERNSTLVLRVSGDLQEMEPGGVIGQFFEGQPTVRSLVDALRKAKVDDRITSVVIRPTGTAALWGKVEEVRDAILDFKTLRASRSSRIWNSVVSRSSTSPPPATKSFSCRRRRSI